MQDAASGVQTADDGRDLDTLVFCFMKAARKYDPYYADKTRTVCEVISDLQGGLFEQVSDFSVKWLGWTSGRLELTAMYGPPPDCKGKV